MAARKTKDKEEQEETTSPVVFRIKSQTVSFGGLEKNRIGWREMIKASWEGYRGEVSFLLPCGSQKQLL